MKFFLIRIEMHIRSYLEIQKKKKCIVFLKKLILPVLMTLITTSNWVFKMTRETPNDASLLLKAK